MENTKPIISIPLDLLPEGKDWTIGKVYRVRIVLKKVGASEDDAQYELADATSLEPEDKGRRFYVSDSGTLKM
jgi:hypothetical protein